MVSAPRPRIRAALPNESLQVLETLTGERMAELLAALRPDTLVQIRSAGPLDWVDLELDIELSAAVVAVLGPSGNRARARLCIRHLLDQPLLRPFIRGAELLFGRTPGNMIATVPRGWPAVYRDAGRVRHEVVDGRRRRLIYEDVPAELLGAGSYLEAIAGALESLFDLCGVEGRVEIGHIDARRREAELMFEWDA